MARKLVTGEVRGFRWFELPRSVVKDVKGFTGPLDADTVTLLVHPDDYPSENRIADFFSAQHASPFYASIAFVPIDIARDLPGRLVGYANPTSLSIRKWIEEHCPAPDNIQVEYVYPDYSWPRKLVAIASTERDGRIVKIRKTVDPKLLIDDALAKVFKWFQKNAPRPRADAGRASCGAHVAAILSRATAGAVKMIDSWMERPHEGRDNLVIDGLMLPGAGVTTLTLKKTKTSNAILSEIVLKGGHKLTDDRSGMSIRMMAQIPDTVINSLAGESFSKVIDVPWADTITIRSAATFASDAFDIRGYAAGVPFTLPEPVEMSEKAARSILKRIASSKVFRAMDAAVIEKLAAMTPQGAATTLLAIHQHEFYDLAAHGLPGWWTSNQAGWVVLNRSPMKQDGALAEAIGDMFD